MVKNIKGCVHLVIKNRKVVNVFTHLNKIPNNGVIHLKGDKIYSTEEFKKSHKNDLAELKKHKLKIVISDF